MLCRDSDWIVCEVRCGEENLWDLCVVSHRNQESSSQVNYLDASEFLFTVTWAQQLKWSRNDHSSSSSLVLELIFLALHAGRLFWQQLRTLLFSSKTTSSFLLSTSYGETVYMLHVSLLALKTNQGSHSFCVFVVIKKMFCSLYLCLFKPNPNLCLERVVYCFFSPNKLT